MTSDTPDDGRDKPANPLLAKPLRTLVDELRFRVQIGGTPVMAVNRALETVMYRAVRRLVSESHPSGGRPIVDDVLNRLRDALLNPRHPDYVAMGRTPERLIRRRVIDAVRHSRKGKPPEFLEPDAEDAGGADWLDRIEAHNAFGDASHAEVNRVLSKVKNKDHVLAFRLYMERPQYPIVAEAMSVDAKTAKAWVEAVSRRVRRELGL